MSVQVHVRSVYGKKLIYPVCEKAKAFARLTGKVTLDVGDVSIIKELGFQVNVVPEIVTL